MKKTNSKSRTAIIALAVVMIILALFLFGSVIGGYIAAETTAKSCLKISDADAKAIAEEVVPHTRSYTVKKVEKKVRFENRGFRPDNAYYVYEIELADRRNGEDMEVYVDGRTGTVIEIDR